MSRGLERIALFTVVNQGAVSTASGYAAAYALAGGVTLLALLIHFPYWRKRAGS